MQHFSSFLHLHSKEGHADSSSTELTFYKGEPVFGTLQIPVFPSLHQGYFTSVCSELTYELPILEKQNECTI